MAHTRHSRPASGPGLQMRVLQTLKFFRLRSKAVARAIAKQSWCPWLPRARNLFRPRATLSATSPPQTTRVKSKSAVGFFSLAEKGLVKCRWALGAFFHAKRDQLKRFHGLLHSGQGQNLLLTVLCGPCSIDSGCLASCQKGFGCRVHLAHRLL